jgi:ribosome-binding factor A
MSDRLKKVNKLIKEALSKIIEEDFVYEKSFITVSEVRTSPDLRVTQVFISVFPYDKKNEVLKYLEDNKKRLQDQFGRSIILKYTPKIEIFFDESFEYESKVEDLFKKIERDKIND